MILKSLLQDRSISNNSVKAVFKSIYSNGPTTLAKLCEMTKLKRLTATRILDELIDFSFIEKAGYDKPAGGRPPLVYQVNARCNYIIGMYINRRETRIALFDLYFNIIEEEHFQMTKVSTPSIVFKRINETIETFMNQYHFTIDELLGIGISTVGPFDQDTGVLLETEQFLAPGWTNVPIVNYVKDHYPVKILLENEPCVVALGEYKVLKNSHQNILYCLNSWVMACGVISDGYLYQLKDEDVRRYGHIVINVDGKLCTCGRKGCAAAYSTLSAILNEIEEKKPELYKKINRNGENTSINEIVQLLTEEYISVQDILMDSAYYFGVNVSNLITLYQSTAVILGGPIIESIPGYYEKTIQTIKSNLGSETENIHFSVLKKNSAHVGSAMCVIDSFFEN